MTDQDQLFEMELLLPFYINGTLSLADHNRVEAALARSDDLRKAMEEQIALSLRVKTQGEAFMEEARHVDVLLNEVLGKIDDLPAKEADKQKPKPKPKPKSLKDLLGFLRPSRWHPAVSLALLVAICAQGAALLGLTGARQAQQSTIAALEKRIGNLEFQLASGPDGGEARGVLIIHFTQQGDWGEIEALLSKEGLSIVSGPSDSSLTLSRSANGDELDALIVRLRASPLVASVDKAA
jgi:hypothetical protein